MHHSNFRGGIIIAGGGFYRKVGAQRSKPFGHAVSRAKEAGHLRVLVRLLPVDIVLSRPIAMVPISSKELCVLTCSCSSTDARVGPDKIYLAT